MHTSADGHVTPTHLESTQTRDVGSHAVPGTSHCASPPHGATHRPSTHRSPPMGHVAPSSIWPLQSSSTPLQTSGDGSRSSWQLTVPWEHVVTPNEHTPCLPVEHGTPAPEHWTPLTLATRSVKSALVVRNVSSQPK
jgi:hypothetical protein